MLSHITSTFLYRSLERSAASNLPVNTIDGQGQVPEANTADNALPAPTTWAWEGEHRKHKEDSLNRRYNEGRRIMGNKHQDYRKFRDKNSYIYNYCNICSEMVSDVRPRLSVVRHRHFSSVVYRTEAPTDINGNYPCFHCKTTPHSCRIGERYPVLLTSSTLHHWQGDRAVNGYEGNPLHMDEISIPGGKIADLRHALLAEFYNTYRPLDILVVCGINNVLNDYSREQIKTEFIKLQETVHSLAPQGEVNSIGIATMIIPPMIAKLSDKCGGLKANSKLQLMVEVNSDIKELNLSQRQGNYPVRLSPQFHTWGMTGGKILGDHPRNILEGQEYHRAAQWREETRAKMLHLDDKCRLRMGKACISYYKALYKITPCLAPSKNEGLILQAEEERAQRRAWRREGMRGSALRRAGRQSVGRLVAGGRKEADTRGSGRHGGRGSGGHGGRGVGGHGGRGFGGHGGRGLGRHEGRGSGGYRGLEGRGFGGHGERGSGGHNGRGSGGHSGRGSGGHGGRGSGGHGGRGSGGHGGRGSEGHGGRDSGGHGERGFGGHNRRGSGGHNGHGAGGNGGGAGSCGGSGGGNRDAIIYTID